MTLPPEAAGVMQMLGPYPTFDEDDARRESGAVRLAHANTVPAAAGADSSVRATQQVYRGESATAMQDHWERTGTQNGHVAQANAALKLAPAVLEGAAGVVSAVKVAAGTQAIYTSVELTRLLAFGGALGVTAATARVLMRRKVVGKILREGSEGTGKVIAPIVRRRITDPMRRVLDDLRRPGGPGGPRPALAGAGGRTVPLRPGTSGPRSVQDGMAQMARGGRKGGGGRGGGGGGGRSSWRDNNGRKLHGPVPNNTQGMTPEQARELEGKLTESLGERKLERSWFGGKSDPGHEARIEQEEKALDMVKNFLKRNK
ncbi:hypothetical protein ACIBQ1_25265 [Nonomuraea sp. NPDC050153]|uniref:hypothetical protein n=1 Tax=Nonomuraea sp. NPDC050153 TaxID=3364359 RepID=UPI0037ABF55C